jgi:transcriptional regulator with XRE-family HTH domain
VGETLRTLRVNIGWTQRDLAKHAKVSEFATSQAENGQKVSVKTAKAIADALSTAYGRAIRPLDIEGLNVR